MEPIAINSRESVYLDETNPTDSIGWVLHVEELDGYEDTRPCSALTAARETGRASAVMRETEAAIERQVERIADAAAAGDSAWIIGMAMALADLVREAEAARRAVLMGVFR